jgi:16S rRNA (guanine527-N7)-methyltransferase
VSDIDITLRALALDRALARNLNIFLDLFEKWNASINLSAATTRAELIEHVVDCLHVVPLLRDRGRVIDVGSGGGFPVVVAAICCPGSSFTALEPTAKKHAFLRTAARELGLQNLRAFSERLESHATRDYDAATSRATFDLVEWLTRGLALVAPGGVVIGFEAVQRDDVPAGTVRHPYALVDKQRALVTLIRAAGPDPARAP